MSLDGLGSYLWLLTGRGAGDGWVEIRRRVDLGMRAEFCPAREPDEIRDRVRALAPLSDVYLGVALRGRRAGTKDAVRESWLAWVDCDSAASSLRLEAFTPRPSIVVLSGTPGHVHAYWALRDPLGVDALEDLNRRLAAGLSADRTCADAGRILRPPATLNHKSDPPLPVRLIDAVGHEVFTPEQITARLPDLARGPGRVPRRSARHVADPLATVSAVVYVPLLSGRPVDHAHKVELSVPRGQLASLHVYDDPDRGWYCFGCRRGGSIYDFAARSGTSPRAASGSSGSANGSTSSWGSPAGSRRRMTRTL